MTGHRARILVTIILILWGTGMSKPRVLLATPTYDGSAESESRSSIRYAVTDGSIEFRTLPMESSLLGRGFNDCFCEAINCRETEGATHFAMIHADIWPLNLNWLGILYRELVDHNADMVSAIVTMKDWQRRTSTAWHPKSRDPLYDKKITYVMMEDMKTLPRTFCAADVGRESDYLLVNTGLWICDITRPWVDTEPYPHFEIRSRIVEKNGKRQNVSLAEDWNFSIQLQDKGAKVCATKAIKCRHRGKIWFETQTFEDGDFVFSRPTE